MKPIKHFLDIDQFSYDELKEILELAREVKKKVKAGESHQPLQGKHLAMIFEKPSTRTRVSFQVGIQQLGGQAVIIESEQSQLGRGETISDTAQVLSRYVDMIMMRCYSHEDLLKLAEHATVPVINGLSNNSHPCQVMTDLLTIDEHCGGIHDKNIAWIGDGNNNMVRSWMHAAAKFNFHLLIASPKAYRPNQEMLSWAENARCNVTVSDDPIEVVEKADVINTDCWVSMGDADADDRIWRLTPYQVNGQLMAHAKPGAIFMHCLPAHRGEEVTDSVIDGSHSVVFDQAENRLHVQKAIMEWLMR